VRSLVPHICNTCISDLIASRLLHLLANDTFYSHRKHPLIKLTYQFMLNEHLSKVGLMYVLGELLIEK